MLMKAKCSKSMFLITVMVIVTLLAFQHLTVIKPSSMAVEENLGGDQITITIDGDLSDWDGIEPLYVDEVGDTQPWSTDTDLLGIGSTAEAPEITLFCLSNLMDHQRGIHVKRTQEEIPALKKLAKLIEGTQPIGIPTPKPRNPRAAFSTETYLYDILGMIGVPTEPVNPKTAKEHSSALITAHGALKPLVEELLGEDRTIILTPKSSRI